jgi:hypothetical protein
MRTAYRPRHSAFTLVELMVVTALTMIVGGIAYVILNTGMILFAKNTSTNVAHQQARMAMMQMERELHLAVSPAELVDEDGTPVGNDGPAAGMSFHVFAAGPFEVTARADSGQNKVSMNLGTFQAKATQRLVISNHNLESDIAQDSAGSGNQLLTLVDNIPYTINVTMDDAGTMVPVHVVGLITERVSYRIKNEQLLYVNRAGQTFVLASEITSDKPFTRPNKGSGNADSRSIAAVNLSTGAKKGGKKRQYKSASMILDAEVPARALLCTKP